MSRILIFLLITCVAMTLARPQQDPTPNGGILLVRLVRDANPGFGHHGGYYGGYYGGHHGGHGHGGHSGFPISGGGGGGSFAQSSSNAAAINTPFGSASIANSNSNAGAFGR